MGIKPADWELIYFFRAGDFLKIGRTRDLDARMQALQTGSPHRLEMLAVVHGSAAWEQKLHSAFRDLRTSGEWFEFKPPLSQFVEEMVATDRSDLATGVMMRYFEDAAIPEIVPENKISL